MLGTLSTSVSLDVIWNEYSGISLQPKILQINIADTMAYTNSADQDQTAPKEEQSNQGLCCLPLHLVF